MVMIVKRGDEFIVPNGSLRLHPGDKLLVISDNQPKQSITSVSEKPQ